MSINPQYAEAILAGTKRVEFRKRRLAPDVTTVLIYATLPVGRIVGTFNVRGLDVAPPAELWSRHSAHAGIGVEGYEEYYRQAAIAVGILIGAVQPLSHPRLVTDLPGVSRPPQSFSYLSPEQAEDVQRWCRTELPVRDRTDRASEKSPVARLLTRTTNTLEAAAKLLRQAV